MGNSLLSARADSKSRTPHKLLAKAVAAMAIALFWCISAVGTTVGTTVGITSLATAVSTATSTPAEAAAAAAAAAAAVGGAIAGNGGGGSRSDFQRLEMRRAGPSDRHWTQCEERKVKGERNGK